MILDADGAPFHPQKSAAEQYIEALVRSRRDTLWNLQAHLLDGWTAEQHRHWVEAGEKPR